MIEGYLPDPCLWFFGCYYGVTAIFAGIASIKPSKVKRAVLLGMVLLITLISSVLHIEETRFLYFSIEQYTRINILKCACMVSFFALEVFAAVLLVRKSTQQQKKTS